MKYIYGVKRKTFQIAEEILIVRVIECIEVSLHESKTGSV